MQTGETTSQPGTGTVPDGPDGWVLYDGTCGICGRWVPKWAPTLERIGLGTAPLQSEWVAAATGIPEAQLLEDLHLVERGGRVLRGAEAYRSLLRRIWWTYPCYLATLVPGLRQLFDFAYRAFATHRYKVSKICRLEPPLGPPGGR